MRQGARHDDLRRARKGERKEVPARAGTGLQDQGAAQPAIWAVGGGAAGPERQTPPRPMRARSSPARSPSTATTSVVNKIAGDFAKKGVKHDPDARQARTRTLRRRGPQAARRAEIGMYRLAGSSRPPPLCQAHGSRSPSLAGDRDATRRLPEHAPEDRVDVLQVIGVVEMLGELGGLDVPRHLGVRLEQIGEAALAVPGRSWRCAAPPDRRPRGSCRPGSAPAARAGN